MAQTLILIAIVAYLLSVSYTHLDVYKRQDALRLHCEIEIGIYDGGDPEDDRCN